MGTLINIAAIIAGGLLGRFFGKRISEQFRDTLSKACGVSTLFLGITGALEGMLSVSGNGVSSQNGMFLVICMVLGAVVGELLDIEKRFEDIGTWLREKSGNSGDAGFVDAFITATFTVCIGAMTIVGSVKDGIYGDSSILMTKSILDFIIVMVLSGSMGIGCMFSAVPVGVIQGLLTLGARAVEPLLTEKALGNLSMVGSVLIFCVGINLIWERKVRVANYLPALVFAVAAAYIL
ncbi:MAG: DUF554 domain-containing protein [Oscillospiraceae bacterium]|nr:DUF554 domain-containing protein [Oscillospiraceae bacterium]